MPDNETVDLSYFHQLDGMGRAKGVFDQRIFQFIKESEHLFILGGVPYIYDHGVYVPDESGARLKSLIMRFIYPEFLRSSTVERIYRLFLMDCSLETKFDELNNFPSEWLNFKNGFFSPKTGQFIDHNPFFRAINQIPFEYHPDDELQGAAVEEWLNFCVPDPDDREMLLEFAGYAMSFDVRQQKFLILNGRGGTGKSVIVRMLETVIGSDNVSSISLTELTQRFASYGLLAKLLNSCADLEIAALDDTSVLKKALGEDTLRGEAKGKDAFSFKSYAKLIFSTNELPVIRSEKTDGFYRRLMVLPVDRKPETPRTDLFFQLRKQAPYFIRLCVQALQRMYERGGRILESEHSREAVEKMRMKSDTVQAFLHDETFSGGREERGRLYRRYSDYCLACERQSLTKNNFFDSLRVKGFSEFKSGGAWFFRGISLDKTSPETSPNGELTPSDVLAPWQQAKKDPA